MATQENVRWLIRLSSLTVTQMKLLRCGKCHQCSIYTCLFGVQPLSRLRAEQLPNSTRCNSEMTCFIVYKQGGSKAPADISSMHEYCRGLLLPVRLEIVGTWDLVDLRTSAGIQYLHAQHDSRSSY
ncbi:uncharacterized protein PV06_11787 [Exophiala oligosperma]|uniref:Uncharacterized protein n=1 Tax=Exophiala oligosperma TaxID=215243 RepID=A0A0D2DJI2_9EURO|nr:uncharacterized protein PV06_11787 [Exophiala oligosperma]KIW35884.1 hypothetical protein PV06_11787 [Exophiala oligosperma]